MPREIPASQLQKEEEQMTFNDFDDGPDAGDTLAAGEIGEIAVAEIGASGQGSFAGFEAVAVGGVPDPHRRSGKAKIFLDLYDGAGAGLPENSQLRFIARDKNSRRRVPLTDWISLRGENDANPEHRRALEYAGQNNAKWVYDGRILAVEVRNQAQAIDVDRAGSTLEAPYIGAL